MEKQFLKQRSDFEKSCVEREKKYHFPQGVIFEADIAYAKDKNKKKQFKKMIEVFNLKQPINRCKITGKSYEEIQNDFLRWQKVSECA